MKRRTLAVTATLSCVLGCTDPRLRHLLKPPDLLPLDTLSLISVGDSFRVSGAAGTMDCGIIIVGGFSGTVLKIKADGSVDPMRGRVPGARAVSKLEKSDDSTLLVWSRRRPPFLGFMSTRDLSFDSIPVPDHPWVGDRMGPAVVISTRRIALSAVSGGFARAKPKPWFPMEAVTVLNLDGDVSAMISPVIEQDGKYLTWSRGRVEIGAVADTLLVLSISDAVLKGYVPADNHSDSLVVGWATQLPRYFVAPKPREEIFSSPFLPPGRGEVPYIIDLHHAAGATFGPGGRAYVLRNYAAEWERRRNRFTDTQGAWKITRQGLEVFDRRGQLLGAYALPTPSPAWIRIDEVGRLFFRGAEVGTLIVARDPVSDSQVCLGFPPRIDLQIVDRPLDLSVEDGNASG